MKITASSPIISWQIEGKTMETVTEFIFLGSKTTANGDCGHEIKTLATWKKVTHSFVSNLRYPMDYTVHGILQPRILEWVAIPFSRGSSHPRNWTQVSCIAGGFFTSWATRNAPWKKSYDKPRQSIKKQKHHFANKGPYSQRYGFSSSYVRMWELDCKESWALKNWCFWIVVLEVLRVPWTARRANQSILKEINPEYSLEGLILKLQYFDYLMWRADLLEKTLMLGKIESRKRRGQQRMRWLDGITQWTWVWENSMRYWRTGKPGVLQSIGLWRVRHDWTTKHQLTIKWMIS